MRSRSVIPRHLQDKIDREIEPGERIEWTGMPIPRFFTVTSTTVFLFAIPWTAFAIFWMWGAAGFKMPDFSKGGFSLFPLFGLPFVLIGLAMLSSPLWVYKSALKTVYVITSKRAIIFDGGAFTTIRSYPPESLQDIYRREKRDGSGDVIMARVLSGNTEKRWEEIGFLHIRNPREVEQMLRKLAAKRHAVPQDLPREIGRL